MAQGRAGGNFLDKLKAGFSFNLGGGASLIGLSIGASSVKLVELKKKKNTYELVRFGAVPLQEGAIVNREIVNNMQVADAIQTLITQVKPSSKEVCSSIGGSNVIIKTIQLTVTSVKELEDQVFWEAEQYIPFDINEVVLDYQVLGKNTGENVEVILVAVKKSLIEAYMGCISDAKLKPRIIDAEYFALQNTFEVNYGVRPEGMLIVDVGASSSKMIACANGIPHLIKDSSYGGNQMTSDIQKALGVTFNDAEALKLSANIPQEISETIRNSIYTLAAEIKKSTDFYSASSMGPPLGGIMLTGGVMSIGGISQMVEELCGLPVQLLNPFQQITVASGVDTGLVSEQAVFLSVPIGLAIRAGEPA